MDKYVCPCGYVYDPEVGDPDNGVAPGTPWEKVPEDWTCPTCGLGKDAFEKESSLKKDGLREAAQAVFFDGYQNISKGRARKPCLNDQVIWEP